MLNLKAPAKINLGLVVGERRADGFHDLETIFCRINLYDYVALTPRARGIRLVSRTVSPFTHETIPVNVPDGPENLVWRAAERFLQAAGLKGGVSIGLVKQIPVGAGLGGGSSDAAIVLKGVNRLFGRPLKRGALLALAAELGSDVPFFLMSKPCRATGRGEVLEPVRVPKLAVFLHLPEFQVSTAWAYRELDRMRGEGTEGTAGTQGTRTRSEPLRSAGLTGQGFSLKIAVARLQSGKLGHLSELLLNSFEPVVSRLHPELARLKAFMLQAGADAALLSGSGSAFYAVVRPTRAGRVRQALKQARVPFLQLETVS